MLTFRTDVLDVPNALATILQDSETSVLQRTFIFRNLTASELTLTLQESADGGATWSNVGTAFIVDVAGGGGDILVKNVASANILRVRGQGGGGDRDLEVALVSAALDTSHIWTNPKV